MNAETDAKLETIIICVINRLYQKEETLGLNLEDLRALEIIFKISKEAKNSISHIPLSSSEMPANLMELLRAVKGIPSDDNGSI